MSLVENINLTLKEKFGDNQIEELREKHNINKIYSRIIFDYFNLARRDEYLTRRELEAKTILNNIGEMQKKEITIDNFTNYKQISEKIDKAFNTIYKKSFRVQKEFKITNYMQGNFLLNYMQDISKYY